MLPKSLPSCFSLTVLAICLCIGSHGVVLAAEQCEAVRPPGLSAQEAEQIALIKISAALEIPAAKIDSTRSVQGLVGADNAMMRYAFVAAYVGDALGVDAGAAFDKAAKSKGKVHPSQSLTIGELQVLARQSYLSIPDTPYLAVTPDTIYKTRRFVASAPHPTDGWVLIECHHDKFTFQRQDARTGEISTSSIRDIGLEPFKDKSEFLTQVRAAAKSIAPTTMIVKSVNTEVIEQAGPPCALLEIQGEAPNALLGNKVRADPAFVMVRFCYVSKYPHLGFAALYSHVGNLSTQTIRQQATAFFSGVTSIQ